MSTEAKRKRTGRIIRASREVEIFLNRKKKQKETYDGLLRRIFGLPTRKGKAQELLTYYVIPNSAAPLIFTNSAEAKGRAVLIAVSQKRKKAERVIEVREVI